MYCINGINLKQAFLKSEEFWILVVTLLFAWVFAAHQAMQDVSFGVLGSYLYWTCRLFIEAALFVAVFFS